MKNTTLTYPDKNKGEHLGSSRVQGASPQQGTKHQPHDKDGTRIESFFLLIGRQH